MCDRPALKSHVAEDYPKLLIPLLLSCGTVITGMYHMS